MNTITKMWIWGFAAGVFLMAAINGLATIIAGSGVLGWVQMIGGIVVVVASVVILLQARKADSDSRPAA
ncbi:MAG: hypothetical protein WCI74_21375 [Actinomycetes bacterium]